MGVFEFVIVLVAISTIGKVLNRRHERPKLPQDSPPGGRAELEVVREALDDMNGRLSRLEEERDFYKALLDAPDGRREIRPPGGSKGPSAP